MIKPKICRTCYWWARNGGWDTDDCENQLSKYFAKDKTARGHCNHWEDNDSPEAECGYGVC